MSSAPVPPPGHAPALPPSVDPIETRNWTQRIQQAYLKRVPAPPSSTAAAADPLDTPAAHRVRTLLLHHRKLTSAFVNLLAFPSPAPATYTPPSSLLTDIFKVQVQLNAAVADLQTHLSLCSLSHATLLTTFAYANKISTLVRSLHSCEQSLQLALDPAPAHLVQLDSIVAQQLDPARVLDYAFKIAGQTSAPPLPEGAPEPKPTFAPDEASMQFGVLFKLAEGVVRPASLHGKQHVTSPPSGAVGAAVAATEMNQPPEGADKDGEADGYPKPKKESAHASSYGGMDEDQEGMVESVLDEDGALTFDF